MPLGEAGAAARTPAAVRFGLAISVGLGGAWLGGLALGGALAFSPGPALLVIAVAGALAGVIRGRRWRTRRYFVAEFVLFSATVGMGTAAWGRLRGGRMLTPELLVPAIVGLIPLRLADRARQIDAHRAAHHLGGGAVTPAACLDAARAYLDAAEESTSSAHRLHLVGAAERLVEPIAFGLAPPAEQARARALASEIDGAREGR